MFIIRQGDIGYIHKFSSEDQCIQTTVVMKTAKKFNTITDCNNFLKKYSNFKLHIKDISILLIDKSIVCR